MSQFDYIFVLASIIVGLALARLFDGLSQILQKRRQDFDHVHLAFTIAVIVFLVLVWWTTYRFESKGAWNYAEFALVIVYMSSLYALAAILYPRHRTEVPNFTEIRTAVYSAIAWFFLVDNLIMYVRGDLFSPWYYLPTTSHLILLAGTGIAVRRRGFDAFYGWWFALVGIAWSFVVRFSI